MTSTDSLAELILLATEGLGWKRVAPPDDQSRPLPYPPDHFWVSPAGAVVYCDLYRDHTWDPFTDLNDAGMLMCKMGISLTAIGHPVVRWEAGSNEDEPHSIYVRAIIEGNTPAAICRAVCECAVKMLRAKT